MKWPLKRLNDLGYVSRGRSKHRPRDAAHLYGGDYPFIQTGDVKHSDLYITQYTQTYSEAGLAQSRLWPIGTLCITIAANIADTSILSFEACFPDSIIGFIPDPMEADARFIKYSFDALLQKQYQNFSKGAAQDNLSQEKLLSIDIPAPDVALQKKIADVLASYDAMIENNRQRITLLEQAARHLYEEWFVRFRFPGHEHAKFINGLPVGWKRPLLGDYAPLQYGKALREDLRVDGNVPVYGSSGRVGTHNKTCVEDAGIIVGRKGTVGAVYFSEVPFWPIDTTYYIDNENVSRFLFYALQRVQFINTDVAVPGLNRDLAHSRNLTVPTDSILNQYEETVAPIFAMVKNLERQYIQLAHARDLLLPRLMSGEVEV